MEKMEEVMCNEYNMRIFKTKTKVCDRYECTRISLLVNNDIIEEAEAIFFKGVESQKGGNGRSKKEIRVI